MYKVAVIGSGMTGLTAADVLSKHGCDVQVFDKGRAPGGRISTRHAPRGLFDHGAPGLVAHSGAFADLLTSLGARAGREGEYVGTPGMGTLLERYARALNLLQNVRISSLVKEEQGWVLRTDAGRAYAHFDTVISTVPAPQAKDLIASCDQVLAEQLENVRMHPVWTCMVEFRERLQAFELTEPGPILRLDRMGAKPGRSDARNAWVIHMTPAFTELNLHTDPAVIAPHILQTFAEVSGLRLPDVLYLNAHRWRYAFADQPLGRPFLASQHAGLFVGGDWTLGREAEHAFQSGHAIAQSALSSIFEAV